MIVRPACMSDAPGIARVHVDTWRTTYRGVVPDEYLDGRSYEKSEASVRKRFSDPGSWYQFVAETVPGDVVGFAACGPEREGVSGYAGELYAIYVLQDYQGQDAGRMLVRAVAGYLKERGMDSMLVWVFADNHSSRRFYERLGGMQLGTQTLEIAGKTLEEVSYGWLDTSILKNL